MGYGESFYLVRHGSYCWGDDGGLDRTGSEVHATEARDQLIGRGVGAGTILLASTARRTIETAEIIGQGLGVEPVPSQLIHDAGNGAVPIKNLDTLMERALEECGVAIDSSQDLVVVTHAPMLAVARRLITTKNVSFGEVYEYTRQDSVG